MLSWLIGLIIWATSVLSVPLEYGESAPLDSQSDAIIDLGYSVYQGTALDAGVTQYLGMRFAAAPIDNLRWRAPVDPSPTYSVQNATAFGDICLGIDVALGSSESEDCLFINVFTPTNATQESKLPVWFYIQGGGYVTNAQPNYNGTDVVTASGGNIVFVNFNYRVGAFGFLASEKVRADGDLNVGLLDERKALEWVQKYIYLFGGDPNHVVIHGSSAGAGSVAHHLIAYGGRDDGLFVGGIGESVFFPRQPKVDDLEWQFDLYVEQTGCSGAYNALDCLRAQNVSTLQEYNSQYPYTGRNLAPKFYWTPTVDGDLIQDYLYVLFEQGRFVHVPIIFGDDTDEGTYFAANSSTFANASSFMQDQFPGLTHNESAAGINLYSPPEKFAEHAEWFGAAAGAYGESVFTCAGIEITDAFTQYYIPDNVWNYRYNVIDQNNIAAGIGVPHTFETPAIFGVDSNDGGIGSSYETYNAAIVPVVMDYWISFIRDLNPNTFRSRNSPIWKPYEGDQRLLFQTNDTYMETVPKSQKNRCEFWKDLAVKMEQ